MKQLELEQLEQQFNFKYPELYKKLGENGMLDWAELVCNLLGKVKK